MPEENSIIKKLRIEPTWTFQNLALAVFLISGIGLYYPRLLPLVWLGYLFGLGAVGQKLLILRGLPMRGIQFIGLSGLFLLFAFMSVLWAFNPETAMTQDKTLFRPLMTAWVCCLLITTRRQLHIAIVSLAVAGLLFGILYLSFVDLGRLAAARFNSQFRNDIGGLPHLNVVAMYVAFSTVGFLYELADAHRKAGWQKTVLGLLVILGFVIVFLYGSRKSILTVVAGVAIFIFAASSGGKKLQIAMVSILTLIILWAILPDFYIDFVLERLFGTFDTSKRLAPEDRLRVTMIVNAFHYIETSPIIGHGYFNFAELFVLDTGEYLYAHNNILETLTDFGIIGFILYYGIYVLIISNWWKTRETNPSRTYIEVFMSLVLINGFMIVYLGDSYIWALLAIMYQASAGFIGDEKEHHILTRKTISVRAKR